MSPRIALDSRLVAMAVLVALLVAGIGVAAISVAGPSADSPADPASAANATTDLAPLHASGLTGEGVDVAVVGVTGFDTDHPALAGRVATARAFADRETPANGGRNDHGTAAASLVARTAPDADLYLATFDTAPEFQQAVAWALGQDVDVVVAPVAFYGAPGDGSSAVSAAAALAADNGALFVASAGNLGRSHWSGTFSPGTDGRHQFPDGPRNYLLDGESRRLELWLSAPERPAPGNITLELHRVEGTTTRLVARSKPYSGDDLPNERIVARVDPAGTYYVVVRGPTERAGTRIAVSSPTHRFQFRERAGSIVAPATADAALAVGAYDPTDDRVEPFSSAGPTTDGRRGVDVVAPDRLRAAGEPGGLVGSSAAAPYAAGVAALALEANPEQSPEALAATLQRTARDAGPEGPDPVAGHGLVAPQRAVDAAGNASTDHSSRDLSYGQGLLRGGPTGE
ncbi:S8 family serine peptidase [Halorarius halobius]|uniref:S8 family serine peptidase n=1 Tax=Halorarius halobius TaxID=2962671 RepID=UPI0020CB76D5|nr:S8 family serine peptidase [Halorarius halobius]